MAGIGFFKSILSCTAGLFMLASSYAMFGPVMDYLVDFTIKLGAPMGNALFLAMLFRWTFIIMGVCLLLIPLLAAYMETHDTGKDENQYYYSTKRR